MLSNILGKTGDTLSALLTNANSLYVIYFMSFVILAYTILYSALYKIKEKLPFKKKQIQVISIIISIITTGSIFYNKNTTQIVNTFNSITGFIFITLIAGTIIALGIIYCLKNKKITNKNLKNLLFCITNYLGINLLYPHFQANKGGYIIFGTVGSEIISIILETYSFILIIGIIYYSISLLSNGEQKKIGKETEHEKNIRKFKSLFRGINEELHEINELFGRKIEIMNILNNEIKQIRKKELEKITTANEELKKNNKQNKPKKEKNNKEEKTNKN